MTIRTSDFDEAHSVFSQSSVLALSLLLDISALRTEDKLKASKHKICCSFTGDISNISMFPKPDISFPCTVVSQLAIGALSSTRIFSQACGEVSG